MILKLEEVVNPFGVTHEYVNSDRIFKITVGRMRIRLYYSQNPFSYTYVGKTEKNMKELKKIDKNINWE
jgi:hypothetical protein